MELKKKGKYMSNEITEIPIFFAVDDGYIPPLAVTLESILENSSKKYVYNIKILYTNISEENISKIKKIERENFKIEFVDLTYYIDSIKDKLYTRDYYSKSTYFRLFLPNIYTNYDKVLYLDADIVLNADIAELYKINISDKLVGAIPDEVIQFTPVYREYAEKVVGVSNYKHYFNAGVMIMNLKELRKFNFQEKFLYLLEKNKFSVAQDQDYLNRICKGRVYLISETWNKMPFGRKSINVNNIKLVHYNMTAKPWHYENVLYDELFWKYANNTEFIDELRKTQFEYSKEEKDDDRKKEDELQKLAQFETDCVGDDRKNLSRIRKTTKYIAEYRKTNDLIKRSEDRVAIIEEISRLEKEGKFDVDTEKDPPTIPLMPGEVDYLNKKISSKVKTTIANTIGLGFLYEILKRNQLIIKNITGLENLNSVDSGAIITCNHFNPFDVFAVEYAFLNSSQRWKKLFKVIREGNYTNFPGFYGYLFRNSNTLPLSSSTKAMIEFVKAVKEILDDKQFILIYPEQSLWWNYKKPKKLKPGAFKFAAKNNVPVIPFFITMENSDKIGSDGFPVMAYHIYIDKPIYPDPKLSVKENADEMRKKNFVCWKNIYEKFYNKPLEYTTNEKLSPLNDID